MESTAIGTARLFEEIQASGKLPTPPSVVMRLLELSRKPDVSARELADAIALDPGLSAKILRFVNSPLAGLRSKVTSLPQAVALMGARSIKMMALSFSALERKGHPSCKGFDHERFALQSLCCAMASRRLSEELNVGATHEAFLAGLLSQIGRTIFATAYPDDYSEIIATADIIPTDLPTHESARFGETYATLGGQVLRSWGLPDEICDAVESFRSKDAPADGPMLPRILLIAEFAATGLCSAIQGGPTDIDPFLSHCQDATKISRERAGDLLREIAKELETFRTILELPAGKSRTPVDIEDEIRERIAELSIAMHLENQSLANKQADLLKRATTDALTGVGNRAAFDARFSLELQRLAREEGAIALLLIDVDRFKPFNDNHGHLAGDHVLKTVAATLDQNIRKVDYCARYGGEEFAVIAPGTTLEGVQMVAERLRQSIEALEVQWEGKALSVTISIGIAHAITIEDVGHAANEMIRTADRHLYEAKRTGRNCIVAGKWPEPA